MDKCSRFRRIINSTAYTKAGWIYPAERAAELYKRFTAPRCPPFAGLRVRIDQTKPDSLSYNQHE
jgi:hypothetical protein